jgi:hypothetical protein
MKDNVIIRAVGRPKKDVVDTLRGVIWFNRVSSLSSKTAYRLEKKFSPDKFKKNIDGLTERPCQWDKYEIGKHLPSRPLQKKVEAAYPGCLHWLNLPVWDLLKHRPPNDEKLQVMMSSIKPNMTKHIGRSAEKLGINLRMNNNRFNYFLKMSPENILVSQDVILLKFTGLLILVIDAENKEDKMLLTRSLSAAILLLPFIMDMFFSMIREELYDVFKNRFTLNDEYIGLQLSVLRSETPYFDIVHKRGTTYPPQEYYLVKRKTDFL